MINRREIDLPRSLASLGSDNFEEILCEELERNSDALPLEEFTHNAGWPDDDTVSVELESLDAGKNPVVATVGVKFAEVIPTGCADVKRSENCHGTLEIFLDPDGGSAYYILDSEN